MLEENSYEPLAELYFSLGDNCIYEEVYCLCSRVVIRSKAEEEELNELADIHEEQRLKLFANVIQETTLAQPSLQNKKKDHEEVLSCYCSASHCSTDEHESLKENIHSDSGADLSESSRDLDWERYWATYGERLVWESWIKKYGNYIDPSYLVQLPEADEETQFNIQENPPVLHLNDNERENSSDFSDLGDFRLRSGSRSSKSSVLTDSLTNITPMTIYSSELSCPEESSGQSNSNSFLSSSADSVSSNEQQWQQLWLDHFNEQYALAYKVFVSKNETPSEVYDNVFEELSKAESKTEKSLEENKENIEVTDIELEVSTSSDSKKSTKDKFNIKEAHSVGFLLGSLKTLSVEQDSVSKENLSSATDMTEMSTHSEPPPEMSTKRGSKRVHERDDPSLDRVKGAFTLMGFVFKPQEKVEKSRIRKAHVVYRKKNIRSHNRSLNIKPIQQRHIRFDENGVEKVQDFLGIQKQEVAQVDLDDFSEKDDSSSCEDFFSAEEWGGQRSKERQKKKKMSKRKAKMRSNLPKEILDNNKLIKYWYKRYRLFSQYDQGIRLDEESWYSVTPEKVSKHTAERCRCDLIIDACCGAGGNAIQFAFTCEKVIAIDIDPHKVELAKHNAAVYGVADRIDFIVGDFFELAPQLKGDVVFLSPPWGGPGYLASDTFCMEDITVNGGGESLYKAASAITPNIAYFLPKNVNTDQLVKMVGPGGSVEVEQNFLEKKLVAVTAYFGELVEAV